MAVWTYSVCAADGGIFEGCCESASPDFPTAFGSSWADLYPDDIVMLTGPEPIKDRIRYSSIHGDLT